MAQSGDTDSLLEELGHPSFGRSLRGYDPRDVDRLVSAVAVRYEAALARSSALDRRVAVLEQELDEYRTQDAAFRQVLLLARRTADEILEEAKREAGQIMSTAQAQAENLVERAEARRANAEDEANRLAAIEREMEAGYRAFLVAALGLLEGHSGMRRSQAEPPSLRPVAASGA